MQGKAAVVVIGVESCSGSRTVCYNELTCFIRGSGVRPAWLPTKSILLPACIRTLREHLLLAEEFFCSHRVYKESKCGRTWTGISRSAAA